ncbi:MAG: cell division protein SepF [Candidatus Methanoperedens sp.]|nr:cell division protein SepF [Candidatus Methanoperedens sp.]MCE8426239.1 cell division protein SepF [Candidatus Methanoperedens sp.]MCE8428791.1 cell division protein SepF [Candidatus Methanoperedens sp.]
MVKILDNILGRGKNAKSEAEEYEELDLSEFEGGFKDEPTNMYIRVAELSGLDTLPHLKKELYEGNILIIDVAASKHDKLLFDRSIKDLKQVVSDVHGDIAMIKEDQVIVTPRGVRIDRQKLK